MTTANTRTLDDALGHAPDETPGLPASGVLQRWAQAQTPPVPVPSTGLRFAFYGRCSTEDYQDPVSSCDWQLSRARALIAGHGHVTAVFFDIGYSRTLPWQRRPRAAALLQAMAGPDRDFDAIVVGSSERAFHGGQFTATAPLFAHYGVGLWTPELGGAHEPDLVGHDEMMTLLGLLSRREIARARIRAHTAMTGQARRGRYLGGRPPYGYRLIDAGPHPNRAWARRGARAQQLATDPDTAPTVKWIFAQRLAGKSIARITRALNDAHIPCPSAADPTRNTHRSGTRWALTAVSAILANPRYTGRQVWNRYRTDHPLFDPDNTALGDRDRPRRNPPDQWIISAAPAHPALVSEADFLAVQGMRTPATAPGRTYLLAGLLRCATCGRRMESCFSNQRPGYRCRHGRTSATGPGPDGGRAERMTYLREDRALAHLPALLIRLTGRELAGPTHAAAQLHAASISLIYDPKEHTLTADTPTAERITIS